MRFMFTAALLLTVFIWGGFQYESEREIVVLDGKVCEVLSRDASGKMITREVQPARPDDGNCSRCRAEMANRKPENFPEPSNGPK